ncbi:MAG: GPR endopeptidase [Oscillospiraceae bacterium]|nr:GPR endopeptidase [Oscillospiraceae bacterium]
MQYRTDLAVESLAAARRSPGIEEHRRGKAFSITEIRIADDESGRPLGKAKGRYITLESEALSRFSDDGEARAQELAGELRELLPAEGCVLVTGLGNTEITPDALGPRTASGVLATRHLQQELSGEDEAFLRSLRQVCVIAGGVLGQTGIESAELVLAVVRQIRPAAVIAVDALACSSLERLGTTIQIADTGIAPGSGVANHRAALDAGTLGVPVIAVGVPTVIGMRTIAEDLTGKRPLPLRQDMMVTPRDVDRLISQAAKLLACGINLALQPQMTYADVAGIVA